MGAALLPISSRKIDMPEYEKVARGQTATDIDAGLSFEEAESEDDNLIHRERKQGVDLMGS